MSKVISSIVLILFFNLTISAQNISNADINSKLVNTWYSTKVGKPDAMELVATKNPEVVVFSSDGKLKITQQHRMMGEIVTEATWKYDDKVNKLLLTLNLDGQEEKVEVNIELLNEESMVLVFPNKKTEYTLTKPAATVSAAESQAANVDVPKYKIDLDNWSGTYTFNTATLITDDGKVKKYASEGELIFYLQNGKKMIKKIENGEEAVFEVSGGSTIVGERHYGIQTNDPNIAGEFVFREDLSVYYYFDKDNSSIDYYIK